MPETPKTNPAHGDATPDSRTPYEPPAVAWEEAWDVRVNLAAACAKRAGDSTECSMDPAS